MIELVCSVATVARAIFGAAASAIFLLDKETDTLVFQAVAGAGEDRLVGTGFPANLGAISWVLTSGESIILDDLAANPGCAEEIGGIVGYQPGSLMAAPLLSDEAVLGLLVVLDPVPQSRATLSDLELLALFADQAAIALRLATPNNDRLDARAELLAELREFLRHTA
jgi:GAF domain-containing protein